MENRPDLVIVTQDLSKSYDGVEALKALNLRIPEHSIFGFLGPNGAGKTTTIKLLLGLARPSSGRGSIFGLDIVDASVEIRERIGYLAQDPRFYEYMTARETLRFKARFYYRGPARDIENRITETLELVGLANKADHRIQLHLALEKHPFLCHNHAWVSFPRGRTSSHKSNVLPLETHCLDPREPVKPYIIGC